MKVNVLCRNWDADRVIPRFARYLAAHLGWTLTKKPEPGADVYYLSGYFEYPFMRKRALPAGVQLAAYFTHREEKPPGNAKAALFDEVAGQVGLRIATAAMYAEMLEGHGPTIQIRPPVERERFTVPARRPAMMTAGFSGYTYRNKRKGEDLARKLVATKAAQRIQWQASGRGWPVTTKMYGWRDMPAFYQSLDVLVVTSRVEGVPMPPLEALSCGVSVVLPRGVGLLDELPELSGIHRYARGNAGDLARAFGEAVDARPGVDRQALRAVTAPYNVTNWCNEHRRAFEEVFGGLEEPMVDEPESGQMATEIEPAPAGSKRGIYCVAFGEPARNCARKMMATAKQHLPEIPICLASTEPLGLEDVFIEHGDGPDSEGDIGGRRAKLAAYELAPAEWEAVLYLDVDTEIVSGDARFFFELVEDGWEFVIAKDPHLMDTMWSFRRANNLPELEETADTLNTLDVLQYNGGVWAFGRNERVAAFFERWQAEYERHVQRDQGALIRAMYADPLKVFVLGNEWNYFQRYSQGIEPAAIKHYPGRARRWKGLIPGRIDSALAWSRVEQFEQMQARSSRRARRQNGG